jgi:hypothetical protein
MENLAERIDIIKESIRQNRKLEMYEIRLVISQLTQCFRQKSSISNQVVSGLNSINDTPLSCTFIK